MLAARLELLDRRILAALVFVDVLGRPVLSPVSVVADGVRLFRNRSGALIVAAAPGFAAYAAAFDAVPAVPATSVALDLRPSDPALAPRRVTLALPRPLDATQPNSVFFPIEITLLPTPLASITGLAAALSVALRRSDDNRRVEGALIRLRPEGGRPEARAMTDAAGDALLLIPALPLASPGAGAVVRADLGADLDAIVDPALARFNADGDVDAARTSPLFLDPDDIAARLAANATPAQQVRIAAGRTHTASIAWTP